MRLLIITGRKAAGKTEFAKLFKEQGIPTVEMSDFIYQEMRKQGHFTMDAIEVGKFAKELRDKKGRDIVARLAWDYIKTLDSELVVVSGARSPEEIDFFRKVANPITLLVRADDDIRYKRIVERAREGDVLTYEEFLKKEELEDKLGLSQIIPDLIIENNGTFREFKEKALRFLRFILNR
ncbi:MAG: hypothetical protein GXN92_00960 [Candidatus Micrarchaeota archaeon]|nr:hypothetical protein [Candidatus Micrarchaeota archaeon]